MNQFYAVFSVLLFILTSFKIEAQINASVTEGCAPLASVIFTSSYSSPTNILWDFGDGATSNLPSPTHSFVNPGVYEVTYSAMSGGVPVNASISITVYHAPEVNFTLSPPNGACVGESIEFSSTSTGGNNSEITAWQWDFGDGVGGNQSVVQHSYSNPGFYTVILLVTDANGCTDSKTQVDIAKVSTPPTVEVTTSPSPALGCNPPLTVSFTNTSSSNSPGNGTLTHSWDFGNGESSTLQIPSPVTYTEEGLYFINYTATDNVGCHASETIPVSVQEPTAEIIVASATNGISCQNAEFQIDGTFGGIFDYGDGTSGPSIFHTYQEEGTYTVTYSVTVGNCSAQAQTQITIEIPTVQILSNPGYACYKPANFVYSITSDYNIEEYLWIFWDEEISEESNPSRTIDYPGPGEYDINGLMLFPSELIFKTVNGCMGLVNHVDSIALPNALFYPDKTQGCAPLTVEFEDESSYYIPFNLIEWEWHLDDGVIINNSSPISTTHTYNEPGIYEAFLVVTSTEGCVDTSYTHIIEVGEDVSPSFTLSPTTVCPRSGVQITNTTTYNEPIRYSYSGDNFTLSNCATDSEPTLIFENVTGFQTVTQFAEYNGCISSHTETITVKGPIGKLNYECNCDTPLDYVFTAEVSEADYWTWSFGDGTVITNSTDQSIAHTYASPGDYIVSLRSYSTTSDCPSYYDERVVKVRQLDAQIEFEELLCVGNTVTLDASASTGVEESECKKHYLWYFGDNTRPIKTMDPVISHTYTEAGDFMPSIFIEDINGCVDSTSALLRVFGVEAEYVSDTLYGCPPLEVNFTDLSLADTTIVSWQWNFGDGNTSNEQHPTNLYENITYNSNNTPNLFNVSLTVTDQLGCTSTINTLKIQPLGPNPAFEATNSPKICVGDVVYFNPTGSDTNYHTYEWDFGNGNTSTDPSGSSEYDEAGEYDVTLVVSDSLNCSRSLTKALVKVQDYPIAIIGTNFEEEEILCYPYSAMYTDLSTANVFDSRTWDLNMGGPTLSSSSIETIYTTPGLYTIDLEVSTTHGCTNDTTLVVKIQGPVAEISLNPEAICPGGSIELNLVDTADLATWQFDFGDGNEATNQWPTFHEYEPSFIPASGQTLISLIMYSEDSVCSSARTTPIIIEEVIAGFDRNNEAAITDSIHCYGEIDVLTNTSSQNATSYLWTINSNQTYTSQNLSFEYLNAGEYTISLQVESALGCRDTIEKYMRIFPLPIAQVDSGEVCLGSEILLTASGGVEYYWQPPETIDDPTSNVVFASPTNTITYTVLVTDTNDCSSVATSQVIVHQPPPHIERDTILRIGDSAYTGFDLGSLYTYLWNPNLELECDTCPYTYFTPLEDRTYTLSVSDILGCFTIDSYFTFKILEVATVDVPKAFTPNGDGINDVVYVKGWGIESLISFSIYNRWGEQVFYTQDIHEGWDGTYKGKLQSQDSYAYIVVVKNYINEEPVTVTGMIDLIR